MQLHYKFLLQAMMATYCCTEADGIELMKLCFTNAQVPFFETMGKRELDDMVTHINFNIRPMHMEIRKGASDTLYYALVNTRDSAITRLASDYEKKELEYFQIIMCFIMKAEGGMVSSITLLNAVDDMEEKLADEMEAQNIIAKFVKDKWLLVTEEGKISLSARSLIELNDYLVERYSSDIVFCEKCDNIALNGDICVYCGFLFHHYCSEKSTTGKCPSCKLDYV